MEASRVHQLLELLEGRVAFARQEGGLRILNVLPQEDRRGAEGGYQVMRIGSPNDRPTRCVLLLGETGAGKTTIVNAALNCLFGVEFNDPFRLEVREETEESRRETESRTDAITVYIIHYQPGMRHEYNCVLIDTPGLADTRGTQRQEAVRSGLEAFLTSEDAVVDELHCVGIAAKANVNRDLHFHRQIIEEVISLFGNSVPDVTYVLATFATDKPSVDAVMRKAGIRFTGMFRFDNGVLYAHQGNAAISDNPEFFPGRWEKMMKYHDAFFSYLATAPSVRSEILRERKLFDINKKKLTTQIIEVATFLAAYYRDKNIYSTYELQEAENKDYMEQVTKLLISLENAAENLCAHNCRKCLKTCHKCNKSVEEKVVLDSLCDAIAEDAGVKHGLILAEPKDVTESVAVLVFKSAAGTGGSEAARKAAAGTGGSEAARKAATGTGGTTAARKAAAGTGGSEVARKAAAGTGGSEAARKAAAGTGGSEAARKAAAGTGGSEAARKAAAGTGGSEAARKAAAETGGSKAARKAAAGIGGSIAARKAAAGTGGSKAARKAAGGIGGFIAARKAVVGTGGSEAALKAAAGTGGSKAARKAAGGTGGSEAARKAAAGTGGSEAARKAAAGTGSSEAALKAAAGTGGSEAARKAAAGTGGSEAALKAAAGTGGSLASSEARGGSTGGSKKVAVETIITDTLKSPNAEDINTNVSSNELLGAGLMAASVTQLAAAEAAAETKGVAAAASDLVALEAAASDLVALEAAAGTSSVVGAASETVTGAAVTNPVAAVALPLAAGVAVGAGITAGGYWVYKTVKNSCGMDAKTRCKREDCRHSLSDHCRQDKVITKEKKDDQRTNKEKKERYDEAVAGKREAHERISRGKQDILTKMTTVSQTTTELLYHAKRTHELTSNKRHYVTEVMDHIISGSLQAGQNVSTLTVHLSSVVQQAMERLASCTAQQARGSSTLVEEMFQGMLTDQ